MEQIEDPSVVKAIVGTKQSKAWNIRDLAEVPNKKCDYMYFVMRVSFPDFFEHIEVSPIAVFLIFL